MSTRDPDRPEGPSLPLNSKIFMILMALAEAPAHGYEIKKRAEASRLASIVELARERPLLPSAEGSR